MRSSLRTTDGKLDTADGKLDVSPEEDEFGIRDGIMTTEGSFLGVEDGIPDREILGSSERTFDGTANTWEERWR